MSDWDHATVLDVDWVSGAALMIRRELLEKTGGFDEEFYMYCEDMDLGYRAKQHGWKVMYFPDAIVTHAKGRSSDKDPNRMIIEHHKSMYRYFMKHHADSSSVFMRAIVPAGLMFRAEMLITANAFRHIAWVIRHRGTASKRSHSG